jgi:hypothetical protein
MTLIISELTYEEIKSINLYDYIQHSRGFFDLTAYAKKNTIVTRVMTILNWYRFYRTIQLNVIIMSDNDWKSICPNELKNSIHTSCWCDVPFHYVAEKRLDDKYIPYDETIVRNIVDDISAQNFKHNLFLTYTT